MNASEHRARMGALVRALRKSRSMTQAELSERVGISRPSITNIEQGRQAITTDVLYSIIEALSYSAKLQIKPLIPRDTDA